MEHVDLTSGAHPQERVFKAGIIPFVRKGNGLVLFDVMVMQPAKNEAAARLGLEPARLQIAKGTRMNDEHGEWRDLKGHNVQADPAHDEPLKDCALREAKEEIGLKEANVSTLFDMGRYTFQSTTKGETRQMHVFAAEVKDKADFGEHETTTAHKAWVSAEQFSREGREDHKDIMRDILQQIARHYKNQARSVAK